MKLTLKESVEKLQKAGFIVEDYMEDEDNPEYSRDEYTDRLSAEDDQQVQVNELAAAFDKVVSIASEQLNGAEFENLEPTSDEYIGKAVFSEETDEGVVTMTIRHSALDQIQIDVELGEKNLAQEFIWVDEVDETADELVRRCVDSFENLTVNTDL